MPDRTDDLAAIRGVVVAGVQVEAGFPLLPPLLLPFIPPPAPRPDVLL